MTSQTPRKSRTEINRESNKRRLMQFNYMLPPSIIYAFRGKFGYESDYPWLFDTEYRAPSFDRFSKFLLQDKEIMTIEFIGYISSITNL